MISNKTLAVIFFISTIAAPLFGQSDDPHVHVLVNGPDYKQIRTDAFIVSDSQEIFLGFYLDSLYTKGIGHETISVQAVYVAKTDAFKKGNKRGFAIVIDGDRIDVGEMIYPPPSDSLPKDWVLPAGIKLDVTGKIFAGTMPRLFVGPPGDWIVDRLSKAKNVSFKIGSYRLNFSEDQMKTLKAFIRRARKG